MRFFEQIADGDRDWLVLEAADIAVDRAILAYETAVADRELRLRKADVKCFTEGGDALDLMHYYAEEAQSDKEQGLLSKAWDAIRGFFTNLRNKLFGVKTDQLPSQVSLPEKLGKFLQDLPNQWNNVKNNFTMKHFLEGAAAIAAFVKFINGGAQWLSDKVGEVSEKAGETAGNEDAGPIKKFASSIVVKASDAVKQALDAIIKILPEKGKEPDTSGNNNGEADEKGGGFQKAKELLTKLREQLTKFTGWIEKLTNKFSGKKDEQNPEQNGENPDEKTDGKTDENGGNGDKPDDKKDDNAEGKGEKPDNKEGGKEEGKQDQNAGKDDQGGNNQPANENEAEPEGTTHASNYQGDVKKQDSGKAKPVKVGGKGRKFKRTFNINNTIKSVKIAAEKKGITDNDAIQKCVNAISNCYNRNDQEGIANAIKKLGLEVVYEAGEGLYIGSGCDIFLEEVREHDGLDNSFVESAEDSDSIWNTYGLDSVFGDLI